MAVKKIRALINSATFPMLYRHAGRSVLDNVDLNARMPGAFYGSAENAEFGVPQMIYCENVLPFAKGISSVGYREYATAHTDDTVFFDQALILRDPDENIKLLVPALGRDMLYDVQTATWVQNSATLAQVDLVTRAYVNGETYICYEGLRVSKYNHSLGILEDVSLILPPGYTQADIRGIGGASNYLLLFTDLEILWCSPLNVLDFNDIDRGAGGQIPTDLKGRITCIIETDGGFIIYGARNAIAATFTNNAGAPFSFKEIPNCGGVQNSDRVTGSVGGGHFAWTSAGLQMISRTSAQTFAPDVIDFLTGQAEESWNASTREVEYTELVVPHAVKLNYVAGRYLFVSYGPGSNNFGAALVYDTSLSRWGKIVKDHSDIFAYPYPASTGQLLYSELVGTYAELGVSTYADLGINRTNVSGPRMGIALLGVDGTITQLVLNTIEATAEAVAIFGHFQSDRGALITVHKVETENLKNTAAAKVSLLLSESGAERSWSQQMTLASSTSVLRSYHARVTAENADIVVEGAFILTGLMLELTRHGSR